MRVYTEDIVKQIRALRVQGRTYLEINQLLGLTIPKSTLSYLCRGIDPGSDYRKRLQASTTNRLAFMRELALAKNREIFETRLAEMRTNAGHLAKLIQEPSVAKIALAMLYLGEGAKWKSRRGPLLGSADPRIIKIYLELLKICYAVDKQTMRCRIQHRADQNGAELLTYWSAITQIPTEQFYPSYIDKRTIGKPTKKINYKGVCVVTCPGTHIQLELDSIADIISGTWGISSVG